MSSQDRQPEDSGKAPGAHRKIDCGEFLKLGGAGAAGAFLLGVAGPAEKALAQSGSSGSGGTTVRRTILDRNGDNRLENAPGEGYVVRDDLGTARPDREDRREAKVFFAQMTDIHITDEQSPLRVEFLDRFGSPFTSAYRPQEGLSTRVLNEMVGVLRGLTSPATGRDLDLVVTTGDGTDNTQLNEVRGLIDTLDGRRVEPDSGVPGTCGTSAGNGPYDGVRGGNEYYEPDSSSGAEEGNNTEDGPGYSPNREENQREAGRSNVVRDFRGLFEQMNRGFRATGLGVPWYGMLGNHDGLVQGNQPRNPALEEISVGCTKVTGFATSEDEQRLQELAGGDLTAGQSRTGDTVLREPLEETLSDPESRPARTVPRDDRRRPLTKQEFIREHFETAGEPVGHGFTEEGLESGQGNYSFKPGEDLRFVVLDSVAENGGAGGNIDDPQFRWLHRELLEAEENREIVIVFSHHALETMDEPPASPFPPGDAGGEQTPLVHFGESLPGTDGPAPCALTDPGSEPTPDETLRCLLLRHPSVVCLVSGHEHENRIRPVPRDDAAGGFWQIVTASHADWPQQCRAIDLVDSRDGSLSIFAAIVDHGAPPDPGGSPGNGRGAAGGSARRLASISRELAYNDPQAENGEDGSTDYRGERTDRNVELLIPDPYGDRE